MAALLVWPLLELWFAPDLRPWFIGIGLFLALLTILIWRIHIYCDDTIVAFRPGRGSRNIRRDTVAAITLSQFPASGCAFLDSSGSVLLTVPGGVWRTRDLRQMADWLEVPIVDR